MMWKKLCFSSTLPFVPSGNFYFEDLPEDLTWSVFTSNLKDKRQKQTLSWLAVETASVTEEKLRKSC